MGACVLESFEIEKILDMETCWYVMRGVADPPAAHSLALTRVTNPGTLVPRMSTAFASSQLSAALFGQTRRAILALLYGHPDESYYLRQLVRSAGVGLGAAQREVKRLSDAGIIRRTVSGNQVFYQANPDCPIYGELKGLIVKTSGVADVLQAALVPLAAQIRVAFIYGSVAKLAQRNGSDVDVMVVGEPTFGEVVSAVGNAQETLAREVNPTVYSPAEFRSKLKAGHHFLTAVIGSEKLFLIGDERELARLGAKRLGKPA